MTLSKSSLFKKEGEKIGLKMSKAEKFKLFRSNRSPCIEKNNGFLFSSLNNQVQSRVF